MTDYKNKYIKYKIKYLNLIGGEPTIIKHQLSQKSPQLSSKSQESIKQREKKDPKLPKRYTKKTIANQEIDFLDCFTKNLSSLNSEFLKIDNLAIFLEKQQYLRQNFTSKKRDECVSINYKDNFILLLPEEDQKKIVSLRKTGKQDNKIIFFNSLEEISTLLYEIYIIIEIFSIEPFNQTTLVQQLKNKIMSFNFKFMLIDISIFILNLSIFLPEYFELLINLMNIVLGKEYDKVNFIDLKNFKYIALKLEGNNFINNSFIVEFNSLLITITQAWAKLFTLIKLVLKIFSEDKDEIFFNILNRTIIKFMLENFDIFDKNSSKIFNELQRNREERVKQSLVTLLVPLCNQILGLLKETKCRELEEKITNFKINIRNKKIKNQLLIDEFISIIDFFIKDNFSCSDKTKRGIWKIFYNISNILKNLSTPDIQTQITNKMDSLFVEVQKVVISSKERRLITELYIEISKKLNLCSTPLYTDFETFIKNLKENKICDSNINLLQTIIKKLEEKNYFCPKIKKELVKDLYKIRIMLNKNIGKSINELNL